MTDTPENTENKKRCRRKGRMRAIMIVSTIALFSAFAGAFATKAVSQGAHWGGHFGKHYGFMKTRGPMWFARGPIDPERAAKHAERRAKHFAIEVDATPEQTQKLVDISKSLVADVLPIRKKIRQARKDAIALFTSENIDRTAIEQLRTQQLAEFDAVSKRVSTALADAAEVLTGEQRQKVNEWIEKRKKRRGWWWRHRGEGDRSDE